MNKDRNQRQGTGDAWTPWGAAGLVTAAAVVCVIVPMIGVVAKAWAQRTTVIVQASGGGVGPGGVEADKFGTAWTSLGWSMVYAGLIAALAVLLAMPTAWAMRGGSRSRGARLIGVLSLVPMLMPSYLAYAALTTLRSPGSWLGDVLATWDPAWSMAAGRAMAVVGLAMWAWPIALLVLMPSVARIELSVLEMLALDARGVGAWRGGRTKLAMIWPGVVGAWLAVGAVMLGSAVPLHLAQVPTAATRVWLLMSLSTDTLRIWTAALPLVVIAVVAAIVMTRLIAHAGGERSESGAGVGGESRSGSGFVRSVAAIIVGVSLLGPMVLMGMSVKRWSSVTGFWRESGTAVVSSAWVAAAVGAVCAVLCVAAWFASSGAKRVRMMVVGAGGVMLTAGLVPGVLIGQAVAAVVTDERFGMIGVVMAHVARFGGVGVLAGVYLALLEPRDRKAMRLLDGAGGLRGWVRTVLMDTSGGGGGGWPVAVGVGLVCACLSLHEIEATVMVMPPGGRALAQQLLDQLHYLRDEHLGAAVVNVMSGALLVAVIAAWLVIRKRGA